MLGHREVKVKPNNSADNLDQAANEIPEEEQWRLVDESGILGQISSIPRKQVTIDEDPLAEEIFGAVILIIPFSSLLLMMEIAV